MLRGSSVFNASGNSEQIDPYDIPGHFGLSLGKIKVELFRLNGGRDGFYLGNLYDRQYNYCGLEPEDVVAKLKEIGVIAHDPNDSLN